MFLHGGKQSKYANSLFCLNPTLFEADKTVDTGLTVSELTSASEPATMLVPMPVCRYEILDGGPTGSPIKFALIGQQVYHKWTCDSETSKHKVRHKVLKNLCAKL